MVFAITGGVEPQTLDHIKSATRDHPFDTEGQMSYQRNLDLGRVAAAIATTFAEHIHAAVTANIVETQEDADARDELADETAATRPSKRQRQE